MGSSDRSTSRRKACLVDDDKMKTDDIKTKHWMVNRGPIDEDSSFGFPCSRSGASFSISSKDMEILLELDYTFFKKAGGGDEHSKEAGDDKK